MPETAATWEDIESLVPWEDNPRDNAAAVPQVKESIRRFGFGAPIIARTSDRMVIAGHTRLLAARELGLDRVPVRFLDLDPADARLLALADNRLGEIAEWEDDKLGQILRDLQGNDPELDLSLGLGFDESELAELLTDSGGSKYTVKVESPLYEPTGPCPELGDLVDSEKRDELLQRIEDADVPEDVRGFLALGAQRHLSFRYNRIAEYYAHAPAEVQALMEESALVIMDFDRAIELGFVRLQQGMVDAFADEHDEE